jgi:hypothetical protein
MEFTISRVSVWGREVAPCDEAIKSVVVVNGNMAEEWVVEVPSLEYLVSFAEKYGQIIISGSNIEIYAGHRE